MTRKKNKKNIIKNTTSLSSIPEIDDSLNETLNNEETHGEETHNEKTYNEDIHNENTHNEDIHNEKLNDEFNINNLKETINLYKNENELLLIKIEEYKLLIDELNNKIKKIIMINLLKNNSSDEKKSDELESDESKNNELENDESKNNELKNDKNIKDKNMELLKVRRRRKF